MGESFYSDGLYGAGFYSASPYVALAVSAPVVTASSPVMRRIRQAFVTGTISIGGATSRLYRIRMALATGAAIVTAGATALRVRLATATGAIVTAASVRFTRIAALKISLPVVIASATRIARINPSFAGTGALVFGATADTSSFGPYWGDSPPIGGFWTDTEIPTLFVNTDKPDSPWSNNNG